MADKLKMMFLEYANQAFEQADSASRFGSKQAYFNVRGFLWLFYAVGAIPPTPSAVRSQQVQRPDTA